MRYFSLLLVTGLVLIANPAFSAPPATPRIIEPETDGQLVNPADVHMVTGPFSDPDGDTHSCSDWEIWSVDPAERVWVSSCIRGAEKVHVHLGDGVMENSHVGRAELFAETDFRLRVRFHDSGGEPSEWAERNFRTTALSDIHPLEIEDVLESPAPRWIESLDDDVLLPGADPAPTLTIEGSAGELLLEIAGTDGTRNRITNPGALPDHARVRVRVEAGGSDLRLPESRLVFTDSNDAEQTIYLPAITLGPGGEQCFWISATGSSYLCTDGDTEPDFSMLARGAPVSWRTLQPGYKIEVVATGFRLPVSIAFVPEPGDQPDSPFFYVTELYGSIKVVTRDGTVADYATGLLNFEPTGVFPGTGEQGITGLAIEPETGDLLVSVVYKTNPADDFAFARIKRFHSEDGGRTSATASGETLLELGQEPVGASHQVSSLSLGPDGKLYVHMGDGENWNAAQDRDSFRGKILRMNLDGSAPSDNPFFAGSDGVSARAYVYAYGFRNPFGGGWRAADAHLYEVENGPGVDRLARVVPGRNYLHDGTNAGMRNHAVYNWAPAAAPVNIVFVEPGTFGGSGFPASKHDHAFVSESGPTYATGPQIAGKRISEFVFDADGTLLEGPIPLVEYNGPGKSTAVALAAGPDGLYFSDFYKESAAFPTERGSSILRIQYVGTAATASGLRAEYFGDMDLSNLRLVRTDPVVDFDWGVGSPDASIGPDRYSARWSGQVEPRFSERYTFHVVSDDGARLWVNDQLVIDQWVDQPATETSGSIDLTADERVSIVMEYFENGGDAVARLSWESASQAKEIIPESELFSVPVVQEPFTGAPAPIPGVIEAENFDSGGAGVAYSDADVMNNGGAYRNSAVDIQRAGDPPPTMPDEEEKGFSIGWTTAGEWLEYTVEVERSGLYTVSARIGSNGVGGTFHIEFDGVDRTGPIRIPDTGDWKAWETITVNDVELVAGVQVMRIFDDATGPSGDVGNLNFIEFEHISGQQRPGDCDQNGQLNITDGICLLQYLFVGKPSRLPCGDGQPEDPANVAILDSNQDGGINLSDVVTVLTYLFLKGDNEFLGSGCVTVPGCPTACQ